MKIQFCNKCDLCINNNFIPIQSLGNIKSPIHFILDIPKHSETKNNSPCSSKANKVLLKLLKDYNLTELTYISYAVKCRTLLRKRPNINEVNRCNIYLRAEKILSNPKIIVLFGEIAFNSYFNTKVKDYSKIVTKSITINNKIIFIINNPTKVLKEKLNDYSKLFSTLKVISKTNIFYK